ncbi:polysaccharide biosynthesis protein [Georgenia faecalis]|uniref:Polysaccharide biosynthesis protein n=1 Tax=Georgenia faecalis TaxID=2483799 RepID=A0ABV9D586_9MICO|nr:nucleoside-diphosphate sugar epimerase/dehydratase [Georgenia faecalis]
MLDRPVLRRALMVLWDCASWAVAVGFVVATRYDALGADDASKWAAVLLFLGLACVLQVTIGLARKAYQGRYRVGSFEEVLGLALSTAAVAACVALYLISVRPTGEFRALMITSPALALLFMAIGRWAYRSLRSRNRTVAEDAERTLVYGAGDAGYQLLRLIDTDTTSPFRVVGLIDDNRSKRNLRMLGVPVLGSRDDLLTVARANDVTTVILAISSAETSLISEISDLVEGAGMTLLVLPPVSRMLGGQVQLSDVRRVDIADVLGRRQISTDVSGIAGYLTGKRVLITGAGGSIGSELARQVHTFGPADLILLDRDESALHGVQLSIYGQGLLDTPDMVLCDIRDREALAAIFARHQPEVVFHAAALKHLPMLEQYPDEGWKTNVLGTHHLLDLSSLHGVDQFVNISTDKAANPTSVLGRTKRIAEQLTAWHSHHASGRYLSVRFGNVLGSRGSMLHTFNAQIEAGGPVTVTHPDVTRFFMTIPEACELVIQAAAIGNDGEVLVLDMGEPVKIVDVAQRLITHSGKDIEIVYTGLRNGEKLHEDLFSVDEAGDRPHHPLISHVRVPAIDPASIISTTTLGGYGIHQSASAVSTDRSGF